MHLPVSSEDTLHFYRYLWAHILNTDKKFLLPLDVPIKDHAQQLKIYEVVNLAIPHRNFLAWYNINSKYLGITYDETKAVYILDQQFGKCKKANGQFCKINSPLQPLANPPSCITAIYAKNKAGIETRCSLQIWNANGVSIPTSKVPNVWILTSVPSAVSMGITLICPEKAPRFIKMQIPIHILWLPPACSTTSQHFHLPPWYETHELTINICLKTENLNVINVSSPEFRIWQHLDDHWNKTQLHHLVNIPSVPIDQLYKHMVRSNGPITPFMTTDESIDNTESIWRVFSQTGIYVMAIGSLIPAGLGIFYGYFFWCQPARLAHWPLLSGSTQHTIMDDTVEAAPIYRCDSKAGQPLLRPHENHGLHMECEPTWMESQQKQQTQSKTVPISRSLDTTSKIQETW